MKVILLQKLLIFRQVVGVPRLERRWQNNSLDLEMTGSHTWVLFKSQGLKGATLTAFSIKPEENLSDSH